eukprot:1910115-Amphidinium_carterae.1
MGDPGASRANPSLESVAGRGPLIPKVTSPPAEDDAHDALLTLCRALTVVLQLDATWQMLATFTSTQLCARERERACYRVYHSSLSSFEARSPLAVVSAYSMSMLLKLFSGALEYPFLLPSLTRGLLSYVEKRRTKCVLPPSPGAWQPKALALFLHANSNAAWAADAAYAHANALAVMLFVHELHLEVSTPAAH